LHRFVPVLAAARGWQVGEIVVQHRPRKFGRSKYGPRRFVKGFLDLLTVCFLTGYGQRPQHLLGTLGLLSFLLGGAGVGVLSVWWVLSRQAFWTGPQLHLHERAVFYLSMGALLLGAQFLTVGFLAELLTAYHVHYTPSYSIRARTGRESDPGPRGEPPA
jgi:dolichol-phosphate mannosyltransferase